MNSEIEQITGDASFREFYRFTVNKNSKIVVLAKKEKYKNLIAYTIINKFLRSQKILAPKLYDYNFKKGIIIIEDFGSCSYYNLIINKKNKIKIYKKLIDLLLKIQKIKPKKKLEGIGTKSHVLSKYSHKYLHKESDLFFDWYLPLFISKKKTNKLKKKTKKILSKLYRKLNLTNFCFLNRDYNVQNIMKIGNKSGLIDSQDALIGSPAYDLVSLIDDVRIKTSNKLKNKIYNYYIKKKSIMKKNELEFFLEDFNILSVQRSLKIIGIFSRIFKRDKKKQYLKLIPYAWKLLESRMSSEIFLDLKKILDKNIPKKIRNKIIT